MQELETLLNDKNATFGKIEFSAQLPDNEKVDLVNDLIQKGYERNFIAFTIGTVVPQNASNQGAAEHMYSFDYAYTLEPVREWLFNQTKV